MVHLSARLMAKALASGTLCDEEPQRRTAGEIVSEARSDQDQGQGPLGGKFLPQLRPPFGVQVVCEGGNCTALVLGKRMSIHGTGHFKGLV